MIRTRDTIYLTAVENMEDILTSLTLVLFLTLVSIWMHRMKAT